MLYKDRKASPAIHWLRILFKHPQLFFHWQQIFWFNFLPPLILFLNLKQYSKKTTILWIFKFAGPFNCEKVFLEFISINQNDQFHSITFRPINSIQSISIFPPISFYFYPQISFNQSHSINFIQSKFNQYQSFVHIRARCSCLVVSWTYHL